MTMNDSSRSIDPFVLGFRSKLGLHGQYSCFARLKKNGKMEVLAGAAPIAGSSQPAKLQPREGTDILGLIRIN